MDDIPDVSPDVTSSEITRDYTSGYSLPHLSFVLHSFLPTRRLPLEEALARDADHSTTYSEMIAQTGLSDVTEPLCTGSYFEGLQVPMVMQGGTLELPDIDIMFVMKHLTAGHNPMTCAYVVDDEDTHMGYVRLWCSHVPDVIPSHLMWHKATARYYLSSEEITNGLKKVLTQVNTMQEEKQSYVETHGPAVMKDDKRQWSEDLFSEVKRDERHKLQRSTDIVLALPAGNLPGSATEFVTRCRHYSWPPPHILALVAGRGCHLVGSAHTSSRWRAVEWRWSFSEAEKLLAHSLNPTQRQCYVLLKVLLRQELMLPSVLCSYHLKTLLFWTCEETPPNLWTPEHLGACFLLLLDRLVQLLHHHNLPHYFMCHHNMLDHVHPDFIHTIIKKLTAIRADPFTSILNFAKVSKFVFSPEAAPLEVLLEPVIARMRQRVAETIDISCQQAAQRLATQYIYEGRLDLAEGTLEDFLTLASQHGSVKYTCPLDYLLQLIHLEEHTVGYLDNQISILEELKMKWHSDDSYCSRICRQLGHFYQLQAHTGEGYDNSIQRAESCLLTALRLDPQSAANHFYMGRFLCTQKLYQQAQVHLVQAIDRAGNSHELLTHSHSLYLDEQLSQEIHQHGYIICPMLVLAYYYLLMAVVQGGGVMQEQVERWMEEYKRLVCIAVAARREFTVCLSLLGYTYVLLGRLEEAKVAFADAVSSNPEYTLSLEALHICTEGDT